MLVNFTGYACTNCHWMKANMFTRPEIAGAMKEFVLLELYTDSLDAVAHPHLAQRHRGFVRHRILAAAVACIVARPRRGAQACGQPAVAAGTMAR